MKNIKINIILIISFLFSGYLSAAQIGDNDHTQQQRVGKYSDRQLTGKQRRQLKHSKLSEERKTAPHWCCSTPVKVVGLFALGGIAAYAAKVYLSQPPAGVVTFSNPQAPVSTDTNVLADFIIDRSFTRTEPLFGDTARDIFNAMEQELLSEPILNPNDKINLDTFYNVRNKLAKARADVATRANDPEYSYFGRPKNEHYALGSVTSIMPNENPALYDLWTTRIYRLINNLEAPAPGENLMTRDPKLLLEKYSHDPSASILRAQLREIPDSKTKIIDLYNRGQLQQLQLIQQVDLGGTLTDISSVYGFIRVLPNGALSMPSDLADYNSYSAYLIHHAPYESIKRLIDASYGYWRKAMLSNPKKYPARFLQHIGHVFWLQTQAMEYMRGSEAITKWFVELTARHHNHTLVYPEGYEFRLPFAMALSNFANNFIKEVRLKEISF